MNRKDDKNDKLFIAIFVCVGILLLTGYFILNKSVNNIQDALIAKRSTEESVQGTEGTEVATEVETEVGTEVLASTESTTTEENTELTKVCNELGIKEYDVEASDDFSYFIYRGSDSINTLENIDKAPNYEIIDTYKNGLDICIIFKKIS